ncbi:MAG: hypothetical protein IT293_10255 [Deltaproteobacteria bacterium]|nr:hypothetical protein [Deltaproteobacteria bacterium]
MSLPRRIPLVVAFLLAFAMLAAAGPSRASAACAGDCGADLATVPKTVEKFVKARWKAVLACGKKAKPTCPATCPRPDGTADPYLLSASCAALVACNLDALAENAYDATWDDANACASAAATPCGNVRAATAGKLVSTKLTRRRANKMNAFPKDVAKCAAKIAKVPSCDPGICDDAPDWIDAIFPLAISPTGHQALPFTVAAPGEGVATLTIATIGTDWGTKDSESVVVSYDLDGTPLGQLVLYGGAAPTEYRVLLGALAAGDHVIGIHPEKALSPNPKAPVSVTAAAAVEAIPSGDPRYDFTRYAPILLGIDDDENRFPQHPGYARSDVPLIAYAKPIPQVGYTTYRYVLIWSNEDFGTGVYPDVLMARYGRTTDIEGIVEVDVDGSGALLQTRYRPDESGVLPVFAGSYRGTHPIVRVATGNGLVEDDGVSTLAFGIAPYEFDDAGVPRELGMDLDPISYAIMAKEMVREGKTEPNPNASSKMLSDARNYLFVDYDIDVSVSGQVLRGIATIAGTTYYSDHNQPIAGLSPRVPEGIGRLAIEVPTGTQIGDIESYGLRGVGTMSGTLASARAFLLDVGYLPGPDHTYVGPQFQSGTNPSWVVTP